MRAPSDNRRAMRRLGPGTSKYLDVRYRFPVPVFYRLEGKRKPETPSAVRPHLLVNFRENRSIEYRGHSHVKVSVKTPSTVDQVHRRIGWASFNYSKRHGQTL